MSDYRTFTELLEGYRLLILNAKDTNIAPYLEKVGVSADDLTRWSAKCDEAQVLDESKKKYYSQKGISYDHFHKAFETAENRLDEMLQMVQVSGRKFPDLVHEIGADKSVPRTIDEWIAHARSIYSNVLDKPAAVAELTKRGWPLETLQAELAVVEGLPDMRRQSNNLKGEAQQATKDRNELMNQLDEICNDLVVYAKVALKGRPQYLEKLGIVQK